MESFKLSVFRMGLLRRFPLRFKILVTFLFVATAVVSLITFTMANLFHTDKTAYIHDLTSVIALHTAEEAGALLVGYRERLQVFARLMYEQNLPQNRRADLLKRLFEDFREFVAVSLYEHGVEQATLYDANQLSAAGISREDLARYRAGHPLPLDRIRAGEVFVENSTVSDRLPALTLAVAQPTPEGGEPAVVAAMVRLDSLVSLVRRSKVFETFLMDAKGTLVVHSDPKRTAVHLSPTVVTKLRELYQRRALATTLEYTEEGVEMVGGFARVESGALLAGVQIPKTAAYLTARELLNNLIGVSLILLILSAIVSLFWSRWITRPIERLSQATRVVAKGQFDIQVASASRDEIGELGASFNQMASELKSREEALKQAQAALIQSEKMAAFGQLGAGIAHEVKNPLAGILGYAQLAMRKTEPSSPLFEHLQVIEKETKRCKTIIEHLLRFARQEKVEFEPTDINRVVEDAIAIVDHQLGIHQVKLDQELGSDLPQVSGSANQLQQVLMNLMINAQEAMEGKPGLVRVATRRLDPGHIEIRVSDTGPGIPEETRTKLFEPFFTTKAAGKGTGLGLSVTYGIVKDHRGEIRVESGLGKGATFIITFPVAPAPGTPPVPEKSAVTHQTGKETT